MSRYILFFLLPCLVVDGPTPIGGAGTGRAEDAQQKREWQQRFDQRILPIIQSKCVSCHNSESADAGFDLSVFTSGETLDQQADIWDEVGKRVRLREMPPEGSPPLNDREKAAFHRWLDNRPQERDCQQLATDETQAWYRGHVMSRRLTRTEYRNAIRDLIGVEIDPALDLPSDGAGGEGFDTTGDTLFTSPLHLEKYLAIATQVVHAVTAATDHTDTAVGSAEAASRLRLLGDTGTLAGGDVASELSAVREVVQRFGQRAWRRPLQEAECDRLVGLYEFQRSAGRDVVTSVREPLKAILISPNFLFVIEREDPAGGIQRLTQLELATRLALFLWSSIPDDLLLQAALDGKLDDEDQIVRHTRRMLADDRALALGQNFGMQWLGLTHFIDNVRPDQELFPEFNDQLAADMHEEAVRTVADVFMSNRSIFELLDTDRVWVNGRLADHYGLDLPAGAPWQAVLMADRRRGGIITMGAVLASTSYPRRTSPVLRGRWILEELLGSRVPPPPEDVPALEEHEAVTTATLRERLEAHRTNPDCAACHNRMDPLGFGLENFDVLGRWRHTDQGHAIDASGRLPSGELFSGAAELKQALTARRAELERHLIRKMLGFALGRGLSKFDDCVIEDCQNALQEDDHRAWALIETIVLSYPFQHRYFKRAP